jgi:hypothetical protein
VFDGGRVAAGTVWCVFLQDCSTAGWGFRTDVDSFENGAFAIVAPQNHLIVRAVTQALRSEDEVSASLEHLEKLATRSSRFGGTMYSALAKQSIAK